MLKAPNAQGAIPCPYCKTPVAITLSGILNNSVHRCSSCAAEFHINHDASSESLTKLQHWYQQVEASTEEANNHNPATADAVPSPYIKRKRRAKRGK